MVEFDKEVEYEGTTYYVVEILSNEFLLVVKEKLEEAKFPLETFIIPLQNK